MIVSLFYIWKFDLDLIIRVSYSIIVGGLIKVLE